MNPCTEKWISISHWGMFLLSSPLEDNAPKFIGGNPYERMTAALTLLLKNNKFGTRIIT